MRQVNAWIEKFNTENTGEHLRIHLHGVKGDPSTGVLEHRWVKIIQHCCPKIQHCCPKIQQVCSFHFSAALSGSPKVPGDIKLFLIDCQQCLRIVLPSSTQLGEIGFVYPGLQFWGQ